MISLSRSIVALATGFFSCVKRGRRVAACTSWAYRMCDGWNQAMICGVMDENCVGLQ